LSSIFIGLNLAYHAPDSSQAEAAFRIAMALGARLQDVFQWNA
jgi:hypothetical protein